MKDDATDNGKNDQDKDNSDNANGDDDLWF